MYEKCWRCLIAFQRSLRRFVFVDDTLIHYSPNSSQNNGQRLMKARRRMTKPVFRESQGIITIDYIEKGKIITGAYYTVLLDHFKDELKPFHHILSTIAMAKYHDFGFELDRHTSYSPYLVASCDFMFSKLKNWLGG